MQAFRHHWQRHRVIIRIPVCAALERNYTEVWAQEHICGEYYTANLYKSYTLLPFLRILRPVDFPPIKINFWLNHGFIHCCSTKYLSTGELRVWRRLHPAAKAAVWAKPRCNALLWRKEIPASVNPATWRNGRPYCYSSAVN